MQDDLRETSLNGKVQFIDCNKQNSTGATPVTLPAWQAVGRLLNRTLPPRSTIIGNLSYTSASALRIPRGTHIRGSLMVVWHPNVVLGDELTVDGDADLSLSNLKYLPKRMKVGGNAGSVCPKIMASNIARPLAPTVSEATEGSLVRAFLLLL